MSCQTCLGRRRFASEFYPHRRPLYVQCYQCRMKKTSRRHVAKLLVVTLVGAPLVCVGILWLSDVIASALKAWLS